jgi:hypothetical protein
MLMKRKPKKPWKKQTEISQRQFLTYKADLIHVL